MKGWVKYCCLWVLAIFAFAAFYGFNVTSSEPKTLEILEKMFVSINNVKTLKYNLKLTERVDDKLIKTESSVKLQMSPRKIYLYLKGPELLWLEGENNGNALVNPSSFPYINLNLNPMGSLMRKDQHHTIHEMGYTYFSDILQHLIKKSGPDFNKWFIYNGEEKWNNRICYKITINFPDFKFIPYTVKKGENLFTISRKFKVGEYMILERNPQLKDYYDVKEGSKILVPTAYAKQTVLMLDKQYHLPVNVKIYDDKGLYGGYEYYYLQVNPKIAEEEFTKDYKDYNF